MPEQTMNRLKTSFFVILMIFTDVISAQTKNKLSLQWELITDLPAGKEQKNPLGFAGPVAGIHHDVLIVAGGANFPDSMPWQGGKKKYYGDVYVYERKGSNMVLHKNTFKLPSSIAYAACCSTPQGVVYAGGENENGISNKVFLLQWNKKTDVLIIKKLPNLPLALTNAAVCADGNNIYIAGGETANAVSDKFYTLNISNGTGGWKELPSLPLPVSHTVMVTWPNKNHSCIYLIGGRKKNAAGISDFYSSVLEFDILTNQWNEKKALPYALSAGTGMAVPGYILIFGGDSGETFRKVETLIATINAEKDEMKKQELIRQKNKLLSSHPGFSKEILLYNIAADEWEPAGTIPFDTPVTTTAVKWKDDIIIPGGEIRAGIRTPHILSVKILQQKK
jgi:cyclically-permuted mutarotase family protein